jgi:hypothetical protein
MMRRKEILDELKSSSTSLAQKESHNYSPRTPQLS